MNEVDNYPDADARVGDVKGGINIVTKVKIQKVDDVTVEDPIEEVADNATAQQPEGELHGT